MKVCGSEGQAIAEYIMLTGLAILIILNLSGPIIRGAELLTATSAAMNGASMGVSCNTYAVYPAQSYKEYEASKPQLLYPSSLRVLRVEAIPEGYNTTYGKYKVRLRAWVKGNVASPNLRESLGDRINFHMRRAISKAFKTENLTNTFHNPAFSDHYVFTTSEVVWV